MKRGGPFFLQSCAELSVLRANQSRALQLWAAPCVMLQTCASPDRGGHSLPLFSVRSRADSVYARSGACCWCVSRDSSVMDTVWFYTAATSPLSIGFLAMHCSQSEWFTQFLIPCSKEYYVSPLFLPFVPHFFPKCAAVLVHLRICFRASLH